MCAGASSHLQSLSGDTFELRVEICDLVSPEHRESTTFNITKAWSSRKELDHCKWIRVRAYLTTSLPGFMMRVGRSADNSKAPLAERLMTQIRYFKKPEMLPTPLLAEYIGEHPLTDRSQLHQIDHEK